MDQEAIIPTSIIRICPTITMIEEPRKPRKGLKQTQTRNGPPLPLMTQDDDQRRRGAVDSPVVN
jgi:hypothetical protein